MLQTGLICRFRPFRLFSSVRARTAGEPDLGCPWNKRLWDTPNVAHDDPADQRFHASLILGFTDAQEQGKLLPRP